MRFRTEYAPATVSHLEALTARQQAIVLDGVARHLTVDPRLATASPCARIQSSPWELRLGNLRVYFDIVVEPDPLVVVLAVGIKERNVVRIGKRAIDL